MLYLADTNVLLRFFRLTDTEHPIVRAAITALITRGHALAYAEQSRREFWNVCTRPAGVNGFGMTLAPTLTAVRRIDAIFTRLPDVSAAGQEWDRLVSQYQVIGRAVHDAYLVALMRASGICHLLTLNGADFARYAGEITVVHPRNV